MSWCAALVPVMGLSNLCEVEVVSCICMLGFMLPKVLSVVSLSHVTCTELAGGGAAPHARVSGMASSRGIDMSSSAMF